MMILENYLNQESLADTMSEIEGDYERLFGRLLNDIEKAENELLRLKNFQTSDSSVNVEAKTLQEEDTMLKGATVEGLVDDDESQYFIAVGLIENQVKELRINQETITANISARTNDLKFLKSEIEKQKGILEKFEKEKSEYTPDMINDEKKKEFAVNQRFNKLNLSHLKRELKDFLEDTESLNPSYDSTHGSDYGHLLQALWQNYLNNGSHEYLSIEGLDFDVEKEALEKLIKAGIVIHHKKDRDLIRMEDFSMS